MKIGEYVSIILKGDRLHEEVYEVIDVKERVGNIVYDLLHHDHKNLKLNVDLVLIDFDSAKTKPFI